uniref:alpha amylase N-terminal ig-like domain-containing protein n=1 Tax=Agathobacter sp. TaxID=2021311 RepID=UPI0040575A09
MEYSAICHKMDKNDCYALEKGKFLFKLKTKKNDIKKVILHFQDKYIPIHFHDTRDSVPMYKVASDSYCDYFECELKFDVVCLRYFFELEDCKGDIAYYGNYDFYRKKPDDIERMYDCPQNLREEEMFVIPEWAKNKVVYQMFPSRFATSKNVMDKVWYKAPITAKDNLQGDLRGMIEKLPYMKELGIDVVYMTPIFASDSSHKYDTNDYYQIDPSFGTKEDLKELVEKAHALGMYVILDAVFNHTSQKFFAFTDIKEKKEESKYLDWYFINGFPLKSHWGEKPNFKTFSYFGGMPKLNIRNKEVEEYVIHVAKYWIKECDIDGWRLDVGDEISHRFWKRFREAVKEVKEEVLIIGEIWHYMGEFLQGDEWDTMMNYQFYNAVMDLIAREEITPTEFLEKLDFMRGTVHTKVYPILWNLIDSHDTPRFLHSCGENKQKQKLAAALQLLTPGMPMLYYGDEVALTGGQDPDCRRGMLWKEELQDKDMLHWYKQLIRVRKEHSAILSGKAVSNMADDENGIIILRRKALTDVSEGRADSISAICMEHAETEYVLIFHTKDTEVELPEYAGRKNLLDGQIFDGKLDAFGAAVLVW